MGFDKIIKMIEHSQDSASVKELFNACSLTIHRLDAEKGLVEGLQTLIVYNHTKAYADRKGWKGWRTAEEVLGPKKYAERQAKEAPVGVIATKKLRLKCGCVINASDKKTLKSCGADKHPVGRVVNIK